MLAGAKWQLRLTGCLLLLGILLMFAVPVEAAQLPLEVAKAAVRSVPATNTRILGWLLDGQQVTILGEKEDYYYIDCYDMKGYLHKQLVVRGLEGDIVKCVPEHPDTGTVSTLPAEKVLKLQQRLVTMALAQRGVPYVWGGTTPRGFDCSGFTQYVYNRCGLALSRVCEGQLSGGLIVAKEELQPGDLILFQGTAGVKGVSHVGMYVGDGKLIHAGSSRGVTVVELSNSYFTRHYMCARRVLPLVPEQEEPTEDQPIYFKPEVTLY